MSENNGNSPVKKLEDYPYTASVWRNQSDKGPYYTVTVTRSFRDENGEYKNTHSIPSNDLLRVSELQRSAHQFVLELRREDRRENRNNLRRSTESTSEPDATNRSNTRSNPNRRR